MKEIRYTDGTTQQVDADSVATASTNLSWLSLTKGGAEVALVNSVCVAAIVEVESA